MIEEKYVTYGITNHLNNKLRYLQADYDTTDIYELGRDIDIILNKLKYIIILQTKNGFHFYNLCPLSIHKWLEILKTLQIDQMFYKKATTKKYTTLRVAPKFTANLEIKTSDAPKFWTLSQAWSKPKIVSYSHYIYLKKLFNIPKIINPIYIRDFKVKEVKYRTKKG